MYGKNDSLIYRFLPAVVYSRITNINQYLHVLKTFHLVILSGQLYLPLIYYLVRVYRPRDILYLVPLKEKNPIAKQKQK